MRAFVVIGLLLISCVGSDKYEKKSISHTEPDRIMNAGFLIMNGVYNTELTAPMDILQHTKYRHDNYIKVFTVAEKLDTLVSFEGLKIIPDFTFVDAPKIDILIVPSAEHHLDSDLENQRMINWVKETAQNAEWIISLCDGAFVLAKAGLLDRVNCTTFPSDIEQLQTDFPEVISHKDILFVHEDKFITSVGGAKSFEPALYLHHILYGDSLTKKTAEGLVIDWDLSAIDYLVY